MLWMNRRQRSGRVLGIEVREAGVAYALRAIDEAIPSCHGYAAAETHDAIPAVIEGVRSGRNLRNVACNLTLAPED